MITEEKRILKLFYALSGAEDYRKANELARQLDVSERTVKNDMDRLKCYALKNGCTLEAVRGKGYLLKVCDQEAYRNVKEGLDILFNNTEKENRDDQIYRIARSVMVQESMEGDGYFRLEELAESLYLSGSDLKKKMPAVRAFLSSYNLTLQNRPGKGLKLLGDELSWRLCMVELYENHFHKRVLTFSDEAYERFFVDRGDKAQVRRQVLESIRPSRYTLYDTCSNRLIDYLLLMRNRVAAGKALEAGQCICGQYLRQVDHGGEYRLARELMEALGGLEDFRYVEDEVRVLAVLIQIWEDWDGRRQEDTREDIWQEAWQVTGEFWDYLDSRWGLSFLGKDPENTLHLQWAFYNIIIQILSGYSQCKMIGNSVSDNQIKDSLVSMALADCAAEFLYQEYGKWINEYTTQLLAVRFYWMIRRIPYPYEPRRLLIATRNGNEGARILEENIRNRFGSWWIGKVTVDELYEARKYPVEDYDCMIGNFQQYAYRYVWDYVNVSQLMEQEDYEEVRRNVVLPGYRLDQVARDCRFQVVSIRHDFAASNMESFLQLLAYQWGKDLEAKSRLNAYFLEKGHVRIHSHVMMILLPMSWTNQRIFEIYRLKKPVPWRERSVKAVVFLATDFCGGPAALRFLEEGTRFLCLRRKTVMEQLNMENIMEKMTELVRENL